MAQVADSRFYIQADFRHAESPVTFTILPTTADPTDTWAFNEQLTAATRIITAKDKAEASQFAQNEYNNVLAERERRLSKDNYHVVGTFRAEDMEWNIAPTSAPTTDWVFSDDLKTVSRVIHIKETDMLGWARRQEKKLTYDRIQRLNKKFPLKPVLPNPSAHILDKVEDEYARARAFVILLRRQLMDAILAEKKAKTAYEEAYQHEMSKLLD